MTKKIIIAMCGGHITPALALIDALKDAGSIVFFGRKYAIEGSRAQSAEYRLITERGIPFIPIAAGRLQRRITWRTIPSLLKIPVGCMQALWYCIRSRPSLIVSFGGYVALPVAIAGWICRIPVITHEQTLVPGLATRLIAGFARRVCVTFPETLPHFPKGKAVYTGLPMREELFHPPKKAPVSLTIQEYPLMYITGGGTGARSLNRLLFPLLAELLKTYTIVHQVGDASLIEAQKIHHDRYIAASYFPLTTVSWILAHAALVVGRSGANTVMELAALGKVGVLVPLPWSAGGEQQANAAWFVAHGGGIVLDQRRLTPRLLADAIADVQKNSESFKTRAAAFAPEVPRDGARLLLHEIKQVIALP
jgi:UDP-N-acetylglucosamine--N-acetylmuramyl-(pentapeptide) pyrophosphoryl-undecaprenol N-acetylglucosamine transferase